MALKEAGVKLIAEGTGGFLRDMGAATKSVNVFGEQGNSVSKAIGGLGSAVGTAAKIIGGIFVGGVAAAGAGIAFATKEAISLESAFAGVIKTTDGLADATGQLTAEGETMLQGFRDLAKDVPLAVEELMAIGELGGQLGIAQDGLLDFTETIAAVGVATNLTTEEAAVGFAQMANIMGTPTNEIENMASALVALGNNMATTERDIFNFATNIAGAGEIAGLTEAQVLGIGAAFSSVGIEAAAGGTATQKVLLGINQAVMDGGSAMETFAATAGISADEFGAAWETDAGEVFSQFVTGLGDAGDDAVGILQELGLQDQRLIKAFLSLSSAGDLVTDAMDLSSEAFANNSALMTEAEARYSTTESQITTFKNSLRDIGFTIGGVVLPFLNQFLEGLKPLMESLGAALPGIIEQYVIPVLTQLGVWIGEYLPIAIQSFSAFWAETWPQIQGFLMAAWEIIQPILTTIIGWFQNDAPGALSTVQEVFSTVWNEISAVFTEVWTILEPSITQLIEYLAVFIPEAIQIAGDFWTNTLQPALEIVWGFISDTLIPVLAKVAAWLIDKIPGAIEIMKRYWESVLLPVLSIVTEFITGTLIPVLTDVITWLETNMPKAIETASSYWEDTLKPAIETVWEFIERDVIPLFEAVGTLLSETWRIAVEGAALLWTGILQPALEGIQQFIDAHLMPVFEAISDFLNDTLKAAIGDTAGEANKMASGFEILSGWIQTAIDWVNNLASVLAVFSWGELGNGAMPSSPPKLAVGFSMITDEVKSFTAATKQMSAAISVDVFGDTMESLLAGAAGLSSIAGGFSGIFKKRTLDPLKDELKTFDKDIAERNKIIERKRKEKFGTETEAEFGELRNRFLLSPETFSESEASKMRFLLALERERNDMLVNREEKMKEIAEQEERVLQLQKQQQDLAFLQQQMKMLEFVTAHGLNPSDIFDGVELGLDANLPALIDAMSAAMGQVIEAANDEFGIASPSSVAEGWAENIFGSFANKLRDISQVPINAMSGVMEAVRENAITPIGANLSPSGSTVNNNRTMTVNFTGNYASQPAIQDRHDLALALGLSGV